MNTKVRLLFVAVAALSLTACVHHPRHPHGGPPGQRHVEPVRATPVRAQPARVVEPVRADPAPDSHDCHDGCDHHWDGVRFVVVAGHRHGHGCGHERHGNRWVVARVVAPARSDLDDSHSCHDDCDHHWDGVRFVVLTGHRHGHGCGHERHGNRWVVAKVVVNPGNNGNGNGRGNGRGRR